MNDGRFHGFDDVRWLLPIVFALLAEGCATLEFYRQAVVGQLTILNSRESTPKLLASPSTPPVLRERLQVAADVLRFARDQLDLEPRHRYSSYARVPGDFVLWNVFATPEFSTHATRWCYPIVGCAIYRGYFDRFDAKRFARHLAIERHDTLVGGVAAYSTLGWFDDPLLSTFIGWPDPELAGLIFHELAHARVFVPGDTNFNEAFASFVERRGVLEWLQTQGDQGEIARTTARWRETDRFVGFLLQWRSELQRLYEQPYNPIALRLLKAETYEEIERCYRAHEEQLGDQDAFFRARLNNARLVPLAAYEEFVPAFARLFEESDGSWSSFYGRVRNFADENPTRRTAEMKALSASYRAASTEAEVQPIACEVLRF